MKPELRVRFLDILVPAMSFAIVVVTAVYAYGGGGEAAYVSIRSGEIEWIYELESDRIVEIEGPLGVSTIEIHDGNAHFTDSPCRDKICISMGKIDRSGEWAACLPNSVLIRIIGKQDESIDALVY